MRFQLALEDGAGGLAADAVAGALGEQGMCQRGVGVECPGQFAGDALRFQVGQSFHRGARAGEQRLAAAQVTGRGGDAKGEQGDDGGAVHHARGDAAGGEAGGSG